MKFDKHFWFPDNDEHFICHIGEHGQYQYKQRRKAIGWCAQKRTVIDVGAHIGLWARQFCEEFDNVILFEPNQDVIPCLRKNLEQHDNWSLHEVAVGNSIGFVRLEIAKESNTGSVMAHIDTSGIPLIRLDDVVDNDDVDLIKIDVEGFELRVLEGAEQTLLRCRPVIVFEEKRGNLARAKMEGKGCREFLESLGFTFRKKVVSECIYSM